ALRGRLVAAVGDEAVRLKEACWADELVRIPPERRARRRAARAQDALVQAVERFPVGRRLQPLLLRRRLLVHEVRLDRMVLLEELRHVDDQVAYHRQPRERPQLDRLLEIRELGDASEAVLPVDVHGVGAAHALAARAPQRQAVVLLLDAHQRVEEHAVVRVEPHVVVLHVRLLVLVRVVAKDSKAHGFLFQYVLTLGSIVFAVSGFRCTGLYSSRSPSLYHRVCLSQFASSRWWWSARSCAPRDSWRASADTIEARAVSIRLSSSSASTRAVLNTLLLSPIWVRVARS